MSKRPLSFLCIGSSRETIPLPRAGAAIKMESIITVCCDARSRGRTAQCGLVRAYRADEGGVRV